MRCPFCSHHETQVKDSRPSESGSAVRRRRSCSHCGGRFTSFEHVQLRELTVIKRNETKQAFDREKMQRSIDLSTRKRDIEESSIDEMINTIIRKLELEGEQYVTSKKIGQMIMDALAILDKVAYIRFASVYHDFSEIEDFKDFIEASFQSKPKTSRTHHEE